MDKGNISLNKEWAFIPKALNRVKCPGEVSPLVMCVPTPVTQDQDS